MLKIALAASADVRETAGVLPSRWLEVESSRGFLPKPVKSLVGRTKLHVKPDFFEEEAFLERLRESR